MAIVLLREIDHLIPSPPWFEFSSLSPWFRWPLRVLLRPVIVLSKLFRAGSAQTQAVRSFFLLVLAELTINIIVLVGFLTSFVSKELVALLLNTGLLFVYFWYGMVYINHSRESTSMMVRLVGIALVTLLVVTGLIGSRANQRTESAFDGARARVLFLVLLLIWGRGVLRIRAFREISSTSLIDLILPGIRAIIALFLQSLLCPPPLWRIRMWRLASTNSFAEQTS